MTGSDDSEKKAEGRAPAGIPAMDRRDHEERRDGKDRRTTPTAATPERRGTERRKAQRRKRNINQYDLEEDTLEFIRAINRFKEQTGRAFPTWSEVLQILRELGYERRPD